MGMNDAPAAERVHIAFFGKRNAGKSSVLNAVTGQDLAVVSEVRGTTTDPVCKAMELLPLGPVMLIDTPGMDDEGTLGELRVKKSRQVLNKTDVAVLVVDESAGLDAEDEEMIRRIRGKEIPCLLVYNKADLGSPRENGQAPGDSGRRPWEGAGSVPELRVSAKTGQGIRELKECLARLGKTGESERRLVGDLLDPSDVAVLVIPIDKAAPKGRLILPQQQVIRDILDAGASAVMVKENELKEMLSILGRRTRLVITDSQVFRKAAEDTPASIPLTSFSILFARFKGHLRTAAEGAAALRELRDGDRVLIAEGCTHHRQCDDIGTVKLPGWIRGYTDKKLEFSFTSGVEFPDDLSPYRLIVHCGGCMLNEREMRYRVKCACDQGVPMTNYGILIAATEGILTRSLEAFEQLEGRSRLDL